MPQSQENWLLSSLPELDSARLKAESQRVRLEKGQSLYQPGDKSKYAYFPLDCIVSVVYITAHTSAAEIAVTGREGVVGLEALLDDVAMPRWAMVRTTGYALRLRADVLKWECGRNSALREAFMRYMQALLGQMMQLSICNRHHDVRQQFCRLLLSRLDRMDGDAVEISHETLASALGTFTEKVTRVALGFWSAGSIEQAAGYIRVLDRAALEAQACDCYRTIRDQYDRLLPGWRLSTLAMPPLTGVTEFPRARDGGGGP